MTRALALAASAPGPISPNPRVGCVLLTPAGDVIAEGRHLGAGTAHAEVDALDHAGDAALGATAVVTLEPCNHTGRTGPCAEALIKAGVARVVFAQSDPNPDAAGGAATLKDAGVEVEGGLLATEAAALNRAWTTAITRQRPWVVWKFAATLDGRSAAADGTSKWITSAAARRDVHRLRAEADTMLVGTGTALADKPALTVRDADDRPVAVQPLRAVMGERPVPGDYRHLATRDPRAALDALWQEGRRHVFLEGGPTLAAAFLNANLIDEIVAYVAPVLLGNGTPAVADLGIATIADALRPTVTDVTVIPGDGVDGGEQPTVRFTLVPQKVAP